MSTYLDTTKFDAFLARAESALPVSRREIVRSESGSILKQCVLWTKTSAPAKTRYRARRDAVHSSRRLVYGGTGKASDIQPGQTWIVIGRNDPKAFGRVWILNRKAGTFFMLMGPNFRKQNNGFKVGGSKAWQAAQQSRATELTLRPVFAKAVGLGRQSWVQIADSIGINLETVKGGRDASRAIAKARQAMGNRNGRLVSYQNGTGMQAEGPGQFFVMLVNSTPYGRSPRVRMDVTLQRAINGRVAYFKRNFAHGVFSDLSKVARAYPNINVGVPPPAD